LLETWFELQNSWIELVLFTSVRKLREKKWGSANSLEWLDRHINSSLLQMSYKFSGCFELIHETNLLKIATRSCYALLNVLAITLTYDIWIKWFKMRWKTKNKISNFTILSFLKFRAHHSLNFSWTQLDSFNTYIFIPSYFKWSWINLRKFILTLRWIHNILNCILAQT
jgi:hypothetical protein